MVTHISAAVCASRLSLAVFNMHILSHVIHCYFAKCSAVVIVTIAYQPESEPEHLSE